jgi:hypothetical protein
MRSDHVTVFQFYAEHSIRQRFQNGALHFNIVFFGHLILGGITTIFLNRQDNAEVHLLSKDLCDKTQQSGFCALPSRHTHGTQYAQRVRGTKEMKDVPDTSFPERWRGNRQKLL